MATDYHIKNPAEWGARGLADAARATGDILRVFRTPTEAEDLPVVRRIGLDDLRIAIRRGIDDLAAFRTDAFSVAIVYPLVGLVLAIVTTTRDLLPLLFPLLSGFALVGPIAGVSLYILSARREREMAGETQPAPPPAYGSIAVVGLALLALFAVWLGVAYLIYLATLGPTAPQSALAFVQDVFTTPAGWTLIVAGIGAGFLFAVAALAIGVVSFPLMVDRQVGPLTAIKTSVRAVVENPGVMAVWGFIVAAGLVAGSAPLLVGLVVVVPLFGHATWHLYRRLIPR